jgi:hypothetical protein
MDHGVEVSGSYLAAIQAAFRAHPEEVWEIAAKTREGFDGPNKACLEALKDVPPGEAMKQMAALGTYAGIWRAYPDYLGDLPARWIGSDPQQAMKWALALPVNYRRSDLVSRLWMMWVARDGQAAQAWFDGAPPGLLPPGKLRTYLRDFIHK